MTTRSTSLPRVLFGAALVLALVLPGSGCSSDSDPSFLPVAPTAGFAASGTAASPDLVRIRELSRGGSFLVLEVAISGPTTETDLYSFAFDLVLSDPSIAQYVPGTAILGTALVPTGGQSLQVLAFQSGGRIAVGVTLTGGGNGNGVGAGEETVVALTLQVIGVGTTQITLEGSPANPQNPTNAPAALDSTGAVVGSVSFDGVAAQISGT